MMLVCTRMAEPGVAAVLSITCPYGSHRQDGGVGGLCRGGRGKGGHYSPAQIVGCLHRYVRHMYSVTTDCDM